ncbi:hypothetical protein L227DRAFT_218085 [Lentinus tigrinus ALCF2SS1-6]|uniref:C3H1-type domain-containing protein n=1 Tax=Lentinus tigrinus ALCF2SS1-6 TaxID=1328759 RepID=A0A5C2SQM9_9APHY|nr:hypothetical protein L227DRAFT_218085 [Lentinus tigrinus ALCF2SS1-6]
MSRGDPTLIHATRIAEPPRRSSLDPSTTKNVRRAAVAGPKNNHTHTTMGSMDYNILQNRANAYPTPSHIPRPDFALGYMADLPQQASRNTELPRRPGHAPHGSAPETILGDQHFPLSNPQGYRSSRPVADGVHPRTDIDRPPQPPSPTLLRILNGEYTDRFGQTRSVPSSLLAPLAQQQPEQSPQPPLNISPPSVLGPVPVKTPHERVIDKPPARRVEEDTRPARRTNVICRNFQKGLCRNQDCPRAHVLDLSPDMIALLPLGKQRTPNVQVPAVVSESVRKSNVELCKLNLVGKCPHGTSCKYSHDLGTGDPNPSPEPTPVAGSSRLPDPHLDTSVPSRVIHALPQKPSTDTEPGGAAPSTSTHRNPNYIVYPDDVCRNHIQGRCQHPRCKYKHWSREEVQAFRAANRAAQEASPMLDADTSTAQVSLSAASPLPPAEDARASRAHPVAAVLHDTPAPDSSSAGDDEPGPNDHKPPSTVRKCKQKVHSVHSDYHSA